MTRQPSDVLTRLQVEGGVGVLPPDVIRDRLADDPDPADGLAGSYGVPDPGLPGLEPREVVGLAPEPLGERAILDGGRIRVLQLQVKGVPLDERRDQLVPLLTRDQLQDRPPPVELVQRPWGPRHSPRPPGWPSGRGPRHRRRACLAR